MTTFIISVCNLSSLLFVHHHYFPFVQQMIWLISSPLHRLSKINPSSARREDRSLISKECINPPCTQNKHRKNCEVMRKKSRLLDKSYRLSAAVLRREISTTEIRISRSISTDKVKLLLELYLSESSQSRTIIENCLGTSERKREWERKWREKFESLQTSDGLFFYRSTQASQVAAKWIAFDSKFPPFRSRVLPRYQAASSA